MSSKLRRFCSRAFYAALSCYGRLGSINYDISNTIVMAGSPRSGTTWLSEVLHTIPRSCILHEPINPNTVSEVNALGLGWRPYIAPEADWPEAEEFMRRVLTGQVLNSHTARRASLLEILTNEYWIIKFVRASRLLRWMTEKFPISTPILLMRHPCAVVASQMRHPAWSPTVSPAVDSRFLGAYPWVSDILAGIETWEEVLAVTWCMDYFAPLSTPKPHPWLLVTYEKLVRHGEEEIQRIFNALELEVPKGAVKGLRVPSKSVREDSPILAGEEPLADWTRYLSKEQVKRILRLVSAFGLDFYSEGLEPDYERLEDQPVFRHALKGTGDGTET
jgi:hypothetical protein